MKPTVIGLLPLYIELYDKILPERRAALETFQARVVAELQRRGLTVETATPCRLEAEFRAAVQGFETCGATALVTLHLAYSPSLESAAVLAATRLPIIVLDTTPTFDFGPTQTPDAIMGNHGIHGVQDMCNLLLRNGKDFSIEAGHWQHSDVLDRVAGRVRALAMASAFRNTRTGILGTPFKGMGDFMVPPALLRQLTGHAPRNLTPARIRTLIGTVTDAEIEAEIRANIKRFRARGIDRDIHHKTARTSLVIRRWLENERIDAFSVNFLNVVRSGGLPVMPFLEISQAMARGIGYAGEGDLLTAALTATLMRFYPATTFTEMFCPDWKGNRIFLSHMGEVNPDLLAGGGRLLVKPFPYTDADDPVVAVGCLQAGPAVFVNLAPLPENRFRLILAPVAMCAGGPSDKFRDTVHGWMRPDLPVADFLAEYSLAGGTHHAALVYGHVAESLQLFGQALGWETVVL